jgi:hypothetical protein
MSIRLLSLIPLGASDKVNPASNFTLQSPISPSGSRPFSLLESPLKPIQTEHVRASLSPGVRPSEYLASPQTRIPRQ